MAKVFTITEGLENMGALKSGGQGSVYKARRTGTIITAVKLLPTPIHSETADDKHFADFQNEVAKLKKANEQPNPNVVKILSSGITESGSLPYIEMEFIEGPDLEELLKPPHDPLFSLKELMKVAEHLSHALAHCHRLGIKHGDIKSNNVKLNRFTGNYVLLDFGLAIMSDEERRTSLRRAGAIEFMAPEQNEGRMLFQSDVYSFGIIIYELLTGRVPFPLHDKGETARNMVMVSHLEKEIPDMYNERLNHLPASWNTEKQAREMILPDWLTGMLKKCLAKNPADRFADGVALHEFIVQHSVSFSSSIALQQKVTALQAEVEQLRKQNSMLVNRAAPQQRESVAAAPITTRRERGSASRSWSVIKYALPLLLIIGLIIVLSSILGKKEEQQPVADNDTALPQTLRTLGQYKVMAARAYFHNDPDPDSRRQAYMIPSNDVVTAYKDENGFIYTEFTNHKGQTSKGWIRKDDVMLLSEWTRQSKRTQLATRPTEEDLQLQLDDAETMMEAGEVQGAVSIYNYLSSLEVPEAMFQYANLALKGKHQELNCKQALSLLKKASDKDYTPAKSSLGYLYLFADNREMLRLKGYQDECDYDRNIVKGGRLLMDAMLKGDTTARRVLDDVNGNFTEENQREEREE